MFKLIPTMRRGSSSGMAEAWARYPSIAAARLGTATLLRDDRILRVMIVRNEVPPAFVEWAERSALTSRPTRRIRPGFFTRLRRTLCR